MRIRARRLLQARGLLGVFVAIAALLVAGCGGRGQSDVPAGLAGLLLTVDEVGPGFVEEYRGGVGFDTVGSLCPDGRDAAGDELDVLSSRSTSALASFVAPPHRTGGDPGDRLVQHIVLRADATALAAAMETLRTAFEACYGSTWSVTGEEFTVEPLEIPVVGDASFAVRLRHFAEIPTAYIRRGEAFAIVSVEEVVGQDGARLTTEQEFRRLVRTVAVRLP